MFKRKIKKVESVSIKGVDDPLMDPSDDCLDRSKFAKRIFTLIDSTPLDSRLRVGIFGDWGSGKTTAMNFIKYYCRKNGHAVVDFYPWQYRSREDAWKGFVASVEEGLCKWQKTITRIRKFSINRFLGILWILKQIFGVHQISKSLGNLIISPLEGALEERKEKTTKHLKKILTDKRLYVFIDDLDRAAPEIVYEMLMLLNEIVDIGQCIYFVGLDTSTVGEILKEKLGYINPKDFLDKVINWPFELPVPSKYEWNSLLEKEFCPEALQVNKDAITSILSTLPRNPRKFKHYLRYLNSLHKGFLDRFGKEELDWKMLYLAQLLRIEFPYVFKEFMQNNEIVDDIAMGRLWDKQKDVTHRAFGSDKKEDVLEWKSKIEAKINKYHNINQERFFEIYEALRECGGFTSPERVKNHLLVIEVPELMTWSEYYDFKNNLLTKDDIGIKNELKKFITDSTKSKDIERVREFIKMLLREREQIWSNLIDLHSQDEMKTQIGEVNKIMRVCELLTDMAEIYTGKVPIFDKATFEEWFGFLSKWFHFNEPKDLYEALRAREKALLLKVINKNLFRVSEVSEWLRDKLRDRSFMDSGKAFVDIAKEITDVLGKQLTDDLLDCFNRTDGIKELWPGDMFGTEKTILFKGDSSFHSEEAYVKLQAIADKAKDNIEIQKNFVELIRMLFYYATEGSLGWVSHEDVVALVKKAEFFKIVWQATTCRPLNRRLVGSLEGYVKRLENGDTAENYFKRPQWWLVLIADKKEEENSKKADQKNDK